MDEDHTNSFYHWKWLVVGLKSVLVEFQCVGDQVLKGLPFAWCINDDVIIFLMSCISMLIPITIAITTLTTHNIKIA